MKQETTTLFINDEIYRVTARFYEPEDNAAYIFHKMGVVGHEIAASRDICNCHDHYRKMALYGRHALCKHRKAARKLDQERRYRWIEDMVADAIGETA